MARVSEAFRVVAGTEAQRASVNIAMPGGSVNNGMQVIRTANPQEYKPDGATIRVQGFSKHPVVHACIRAIADIVASVPLRVVTERGNSEAAVPDSHPLQQLLDYPNTRMTARQFRARFAVDFLGYGNAMFQLERAGENGRIISLRPLNPEAVQSVWVDKDGDAARYDVSDWNGVLQMIAVQNILHFRDLDMPKPYAPDVFGFPRGAAAIGALISDQEATQYVRQVVTNDGTPTFAVLLADEATVDDARAMQDRYTERVVDRGRRGTPAFFGAVRDIKPLGFTLADLEFPNLRKVSREDICAAFGVDPRMIGIASASNDAGLSGVQYAEARARLVQHTIEPLLSAFEDELNAWLAPEYGNVWIEYDHAMLRDLVENDTETSTRVRSEFQLGLRTWEESRSVLKLPPKPEPTDSVLTSAGSQLIPAAVAVIDPTTILDVEGEPNVATPDAVTPEENVQAQALNGAQVEALVALLSTLANGGLPATTVQAIVISAFPMIAPELVSQMIQGLEGFVPALPPELAAPMPAEAPEAEEPEESEEMEDESEMESEDETEDEDERSLVRSEPDPRRAIWERAVMELDRRELAFKSLGMSAFASEGREVAKIFRGEGRADPTLQRALKKVLERLGPDGDFRAEWEDTYRRIVGETFIVGATDVAGANTTFTLRSPQVVAAIDKRVGKLAEYITEETAKQVTAAVRAAEIGGLSVAETARLIQATAYGEQMTDTRATRIARTESAGAMSQGGWDQAQDANKEAGVDIYTHKEWLAFSDQETRLTHTDAMGQGRIPMDEAFGNGLQYPLDPAGDAGEVINCRCVLAYYTEA